MRRRIEIAAAIFKMKTRDAIREHVVMRLQVSRRRADVQPIGPLWNMRKKRVAFFQEIWKQTVFERMILAFGNQIEHARLEHVGPGVYVAARSLFRFRFFEKAKHSSIAVGFDDAIHARVLDRRQNDRGYGLALFV